MLTFSTEGNKNENERRVNFINFITIFYESYSLSTSKLNYNKTKLQIVKYEKLIKIKMLFVSNYFLQLLKLYDVEK